MERNTMPRPSPGYERNASGSDDSFSSKVFAGSFRSFRKRFANQGAALQNLVSINSRIFRNFRYLF
jgi:hypothetical protein